MDKCDNIKDFLLLGSRLCVRDLSYIEFKQLIRDCNRNRKLRENVTTVDNLAEYHYLLNQCDNPKDYLRIASTIHINGFTDAEMTVLMNTAIRDCGVITEINNIKSINAQINTIDNKYNE